MNKKLSKCLGLVLLLMPLLPFSLVNAETVDDVPIEETTISSMADDPLKEYKEKAASQVSTIEEPEREEPESKPKTQSAEDTPTTESSADTPEKETKPKPQPRGGGIGPQAVNLIEGVHIDAGFAEYIRNGTTGSNFNDSAVNTGFTGSGKAKDTLTDDDMKTLTFVSSLAFLSLPFSSLKGIEYAVNLKQIKLDYNNFTSLDFSKNTKIETLMLRYSPSLTSLDITQCPELVSLSCINTPLANLDITQNPKLESLQINNSQISDIDITNNSKIKYFMCYDTNLSNLSITHLDDLVHLECFNSLLTDLDVTQNSNLMILGCSNNALGSLDVSQNPDLVRLTCSSTQISSLDVTQNAKLTTLDCKWNQIENLDISNNPLLTSLICHGNKIKSMDASQNTELKRLECYQNEISYLNVANTKLEHLDCNENHISDISSANGLTNLTYLNASQQSLFVPVPSVSGNQATVDILKTAGSVGLSADGYGISPIPTITINGDKIELGNVTRESLDNKNVSFEYDDNQLIEGANFGTKKFSGRISFYSVSDLGNKMMPNVRKTKSGEDVLWTWTIASLTSKKTENIHATVNLPAGLVIDPSSIMKDGVSSTLGDINGTNNLGDLNQGESITFTFTTTATGSVDEWLEAEGRLDWEDDTITSPYHNESKGRVQIQDDEQTYTPKDSDDMSIQSVPVYFNHGTNPILSTAQTHHLHSMNYQSNTKVVTDGFYTRIKDDRATSTGWKLTAKLSDFKDSANVLMPNGTGTSLKLDNMSIERVTDRDTPQEVIDPSPSGADVPSSVQTTETLVAGQPTAKTLVTAQPNEGEDTWQLRMPFDKISLNLPANAGKKGTVYKAKLTWSLDDTP